MLAVVSSPPMASRFQAMARRTQTPEGQKMNWARSVDDLKLPKFPPTSLAMSIDDQMAMVTMLQVLANQRSALSQGGR